LLLLAALSSEESDFDITLSQHAAPVISAELPQLDGLDAGASSQPDADNLVLEFGVTLGSDLFSAADLAIEVESKSGGLFDFEFVTPSELELGSVHLVLVSAGVPPHDVVMLLVTAVDVVGSLVLNPFPGVLLQLGASDTLELFASSHFPDS